MTAIAKPLLSFSEFARGVRVETAFDVLAVARRLKSAGKRVIELEIGDSPFPSTAAAKAAGVEAIRNDLSHYCPSVGIDELRRAASAYVNREHGLATTAANIVVGPGAKVFELFFCEAFLDPGDGVLVFSPHFPTYLPNIARRGARVWLADLKQEREFRPDLNEVERFLRDDPRPKAIFLNSPHNPTGGVATDDDLAGLAEAVRGRDVAVFSDEPYDQMVWRGRHRTLLSQPGMMRQCVAAYTFSKSYSMSGWRLGFAVACPEVVERFSTLLNTSLSCVAPLVQLAGAAALDHDAGERDRTMRLFQGKVELLARGLNQIEGIHCLAPAATFYAFPNVAAICNRLGLTSQGLAMFLLEAADDCLGVACLGGESFGAAGAGFLRFSCAEPDERLEEALDFLPRAFSQIRRAEEYLAAHPQFRLTKPMA
ncbi:MAG TPA: aminotransferase class I/II-fold pyridoxal phosphate-dependent enzyme [Pirellulales bacterium]|nr:aminotransferase class I/II-fold pyridoxal phosphate-dependent enzyme [Pirellulales bacterium]